MYCIMGYAFIAAIRIAYSDCDDGDEDGRDGARSAVKSGGYCVAKTPTDTSDASSMKANRP